MARSSQVFASSLFPLAAARLASGTKGVDHDEPVDPGEYDRAFATDGEAA